MLINPFRDEDTVLNHLRFDFHGLVRLLQGLRLHFLPSSTACRKILLHFFYCLCFKFCCAFTFCLLVVCLCLNFLAFLNSFLSVQCCKYYCVVFLTVWGKFSWLLHCYCFKFSFLVCCLLVPRVCWFVPLSVKIICLPCCL